jgi:hypothetical protein
MNYKQQRITSKEIHKEAEEYMKQILLDFSDNLTLQSKILASDDEIVLKVHVRRAYRIITNKMRETWLPELLKIIGGGIAGSAIIGFIYEASFFTKTSIQEPRPLLLIMYFTLTLFSALLIALGFIVETRNR